MTIFDIITGRFGTGVTVLIATMPETSVVTCASESVADSVKEFLETQEWAEGVHILPWDLECVGFTADVYDTEANVA